MRLYSGLPALGPCDGCGFTTCRCRAELVERIAAAEREVIRVAEASHTGGDGCALCEAVAALRRAREGK